MSNIIELDLNEIVCVAGGRKPKKGKPKIVVPGASVASAPVDSAVKEAIPAPASPTSSITSAISSLGRSAGSSYSSWAWTALKWIGFGVGIVVAYRARGANKSIGVGLAVYFATKIFPI